MTKISRKKNKTEATENKTTIITEDILHITKEEIKPTESTSTSITGKTVSAIAIFGTMLLVLFNPFKKKPEEGQGTIPYTDDDKPDDGNGGYKKSWLEEEFNSEDDEDYNHEDEDTDSHSGDEDSDYDKEDSFGESKDDLHKSNIIERSIGDENNRKPFTRSSYKGEDPTDNVHTTVDESFYTKSDYTGYTLGATGIATVLFTAYSGDLESLGSTLSEVSGSIPNIFDSYSTFI